MEMIPMGPRSRESIQQRQSHVKQQYYNRKEGRVLWGVVERRGPKKPLNSSSGSAILARQPNSA